MTRRGRNEASVGMHDHCAANIGCDAHYLDRLSYDCINVLLEWDNRHHIDLKWKEIMRDPLEKIGIIQSSTIHVLNHFSHDGGAGYDELVPLGQEMGGCCFLRWHGNCIMRDKKGDTIMRIIRAKDRNEASYRVANMIYAQVLLKPDSVLGLATGSSPTNVYADLIDRHRRGELDFSRVRTVNLDEYIGLGADHPQSYAWYMRQHLFDHIQIDLNNTHIPNGLEADKATMVSAALSMS